MRIGVVLAAGALLGGGCDVAQQAVENEIRAEVRGRAEEAGNALRNGTDLDERFGNAAGDILQGEEAIRARAEREVEQRIGDAANAVTGGQR